MISPSSLLDHYVEEPLCQDLEFTNELPKSKFSTTSVRLSPLCLNKVSKLKKTKDLLCIKESPPLFTFNMRPFQYDEMLCLKQLLTSYDVQLDSKTLLRNIDLSWIYSGKKVPFFLTLETFDDCALSTDFRHYNDSNGSFFYSETLINSPRSALVLLRNGVSAYQLLKRPISFYSLITESLDEDVLLERKNRAEEERLFILNGLKSQYKECCSIFPTREECMLIIRGRRAFPHQNNKKIESKSRLSVELEKVHDSLHREMEFTRQRLNILEEASDREITNRNKRFLFEEMLKRVIIQKSKQREERNDQSAVIRQRNEALSLLKQEGILKRIKEKEDYCSERLLELRSKRKQHSMTKSESYKQRLSNYRAKFKSNTDSRMMKYHLKEEILRNRLLSLEEKASQEFLFKLRKRQDTHNIRRNNAHMMLKLRQRAFEIRMEEMELNALERARVKENERRHDTRRKKLMQQKRLEAASLVLAASKETDELRIRSILEAASTRMNEQEAHQAQRKHDQLLDKELSTFLTLQRLRIVKAKKRQEDFIKLIQQSRMAEKGEYLQVKEELKNNEVECLRDIRRKARLYHNKLSDAQTEEICRIEKEKASELYLLRNPKETYTSA